MIGSTNKGFLLYRLGLAAAMQKREEWAGMQGFPECSLLISRKSDFNVPQAAVLLRQSGQQRGHISVCVIPKACYKKKLTVELGGAVGAPELLGGSVSLRLLANLAQPPGALWAGQHACTARAERCLSCEGSADGAHCRPCTGTVKHTPLDHQAVDAACC